MGLLKDKGAPLTSIANGNKDVIPSRWLATLNGTTVVQKVPLDVQPGALSTTVVEDKVVQTLTDERERTIIQLADASGMTLTDYEYDPESGVVVPKVETIIPAGVETPTGIQPDGTFVQIQQLNGQLSLKTVSKASGLTYRTWNSSEHVSLPRVLTQFGFVVINDKSYKNPYGDFPDHEDPDYIYPGGQILFVGAYIELKEYSANYIVAVEEWWSYTQFSSLEVTTFHAQSFSWVTPFNSGTVPECLHGAISIDYTTGTNHPRYSYVVGTYDYPETNYTDLSGMTVVLEDSQVPHKGGWLRTKKSITLA